MRVWQAGESTNFVACAMEHEEKRVQESNTRRSHHRSRRHRGSC